MLEINLPDIVAELTEAFNAYEQALTTNDIAKVNDLFWDNALTMRYGIRGGEHHYSHAAIAEFRIKRGAVNQKRILQNLHITTFGRDFGTANTEFIVASSGKIGRQSQTWVRTERGWKIVSAHVSIGQ
jgi:ketosteroid isomerase-like protein